VTYHCLSCCSSVITVSLSHDWSLIITTVSLAYSLIFRSSHFYDSNFFFGDCAVICERVHKPLTLRSSSAESIGGWDAADIMALKGIKVVELAGLAPSPVCGMILADYGASVTRVDRTDLHSLNYDVTGRGKRSIAVNIKDAKGQEIVRNLCRKSDVLLEPFRCGVMEKLGLGPEKMLAENPSLVYARLTGYGQSGPYADMAGHDINYIATSGVLSRLGRKGEPPYAPINLLADFAGGSFVCAMGIMAALLERGVSGKGQVIDANMVEGSAYVSSWIFKSQQMFVWSGKGRGQNFLDGGAAFYDTYRTKDDEYMAVGALEPQFYAQLLEKLGETEDELPQFGDPEGTREKLRLIFAGKTRAEWTEIFEGSDACVTPVVDLQEAPLHPHNKARNSFVQDANGVHSPVPAPRLSRTPAVANVSDGDPEMGKHTVKVLQEIGYSSQEIDSLLEKGVIAQQSNNQSKL